MKRTSAVISVILAFAILVSLLPSVFAADQKTSSKPKGIILTTVDVKESYKILGILTVRSGETSLDSINEKLKEMAKTLGADCVIGVRYFSYSNYVYGYGTAIKLKE